MYVVLLYDIIYILLLCIIVYITDPGSLPQVPTAAAAAAGEAHRGPPVLGCGQGPADRAGTVHDPTCRRHARGWYICIYVCVVYICCVLIGT